MNQSYNSFYKSNDHIELWMTIMVSFDPIRQRRAIFAYSRKLDQATCWILGKRTKVSCK